MNHTIEKRVSALERRLHPEPKGGPLIVFIRPIGYDGMTREAFDAEIKALGAGDASFILPRPGDSFDKTEAERGAEAKLKEAGDRAFVIEVVHVPKAG